MSVYHRYVSGEHDKNHFKNDCAIDHRIIIRQLQGQFHHSNKHGLKEHDLKKLNERYFTNSIVFHGFDDLLFNDKYIVIINNYQSHKISSISIDKFGIRMYDNLKLNPNSRFWPSCENLLPNYKNLNSRRTLAITNLKDSNKLLNEKRLQLPMWDETNAGNMANKMKLIKNHSSGFMSEKFLGLGLLQQHKLNSLNIDVVYDNEGEEENNNRLVYLLGDQLEQLFDPLLEYSPERIQKLYVPSYQETTISNDNTAVSSIIEELISVQSHYTMGLVNLLQYLIIPLRISNNDKNLRKINQIFPPTIDELTRVNCILNDSLLKAQKVNYIEVIKVLGLILPLFYKPCIRHEANIKEYHSNLKRFHDRNKELFESSKINTRNLTVREIDSIVTGALLELSKMKLILIRLLQVIKEEKLKMLNFDDGETLDDEDEVIQKYARLAFETIDAFGFEHDTQVSSNRVFTPSGKFLVELATKWPNELQYGWITRKVVAIIEMKNLQCETNFDCDVLIIFSDYLVILTIVDEKYYSNNNEGLGISIPDVLMHSLMNEKPLPSTEKFPLMEVTHWCRVDEVLPSSFECLNENLESVERLRLLSTTSGFNTTSSKPVVSKIYSILSKTTCDEIIELIAKANLLYKETPFHLFKSSNENLNFYFTAHEKTVYQREKCRSRYLICLNMNNDVPAMFEADPNLQLVLQISITGDELQIRGYDKPRKKQINQVILESELTQFIHSIMVENFNALFTTVNSISLNVVESNARALGYITENVKEKDVAETSDSKSMPRVDEIKPRKRKSSIFERLFKKNHKSEEKKLVSSTIPNTFIPRGEKKEYVECYKPMPRLQSRADSEVSTLHKKDFHTGRQQNNDEDDVKSVKKGYGDFYKPIARSKSNTESIKHERSSSGISPAKRKNQPSLEVSSQFEFPSRITKVDPGPSTIKRVSTFDDVSIPKFNYILRESEDTQPNWEIIYPSIRQLSNQSRQFSNRSRKLSNQSRHSKQSSISAKSRLKREESVQSTSSKQFINQFERFINFEFENQPPKDLRPFRSNASLTTLTSESEAQITDNSIYFSEELENELKQLNSLSSEGTVVQIEPTKPIQDTMRDESIIQLSELLTKSVDFGEFNIY